MEKVKFTKIFVDQHNIKHDINCIQAESILLKNNHLNDNKSWDKIRLKREDHQAEWNSRGETNK